MNCGIIGGSLSHVIQSIKCKTGTRALCIEAVIKEKGEFLGKNFYCILDINRIFLHISLKA